MDARLGKLGDESLPSAITDTIHQSMHRQIVSENVDADSSTLPQVLSRTYESHQRNRSSDESLNNFARFSDSAACPPLYKVGPQTKDMFGGFYLIEETLTLTTEVKKARRLARQTKLHLQANGQNLRQPNGLMVNEQGITMYKT